MAKKKTKMEAVYFSTFGTFSIRWSWPFPGGATPRLFPDSKSSILGLSNDVSFVSEFVQKGGKNYIEYWASQN